MIPTGVQVFQIVLYAGTFNVSVALLRTVAQSGGISPQITMSDAFENTHWTTQAVAYTLMGALPTILFPCVVLAEYFCAHVGLQTARVSLLTVTVLSSVLVHFWAFTQYLSDFANGTAILLPLDAFSVFDSPALSTTIYGAVGVAGVLVMLRYVYNELVRPFTESCFSVVVEIKCDHQ